MIHRREEQEVLGWELSKGYWSILLQEPQDGGEGRKVCPGGRRWFLLPSWQCREDIVLGSDSNGWLACGVFSPCTNDGFVMDVVVVGVVEAKRGLEDEGKGGENPLPGWGRARRVPRVQTSNQTMRGIVVDDGIRMDGMIQQCELPWGDE